MGYWTSLIILVVTFKQNLNFKIQMLAGIRLILFLNSRSEENSTLGRYQVSISNEYLDRSCIPKKSDKESRISCLAFQMMLLEKETCFTWQFTFACLLLPSFELLGTISCWIWWKWNWNKKFAESWWFLNVSQQITSWTSYEKIS